jgi:hypothetical protein
MASRLRRLQGSHRAAIPAACTRWRPAISDSHVFGSEIHERCVNACWTVSFPFRDAVLMRLSDEYSSAKGPAFGQASSLAGADRRLELVDESS